MEGLLSEVPWALSEARALLGLAALAGTRKSPLDSLEVPAGVLGEEEAGGRGRSRRTAADVGSAWAAYAWFPAWALVSAQAPPLRTGEMRGRLKAEEKLGRRDYRGALAAFQPLLAESSDLAGNVLLLADVGKTYYHIGEKLRRPHSLILNMRWL